MSEPWPHKCPACSREHYWTQMKVNVYVVVCTAMGGLIGWLLAEHPHARF